MNSLPPQRMWEAFWPMGDSGGPGLFYTSTFSFKIALVYDLIIPRCLQYSAMQLPPTPPRNRVSRPKSDNPKRGFAFALPLPRTHNLLSLLQIHPNISIISVHFLFCIFCLVNCFVDPPIPPCDRLSWSLGASPLPAFRIADPGFPNRGISSLAIVCAAMPQLAGKKVSRKRTIPLVPGLQTFPLSGLLAGHCWSPHSLRGWAMASPRTTRQSNSPRKHNMAQRRNSNR